MISANYINLGYAHFQLKNLEKAKEYYDLAFNLLSESFDNQNSGIFIDLFENHALYYSSIQNEEKEKEFKKKSINLNESLIKLSESFNHLKEKIFNEKCLTNLIKEKPKPSIIMKIFQRITHQVVCLNSMKFFNINLNPRYLI